MADVSVHLTVGVGGHATGFELRIGDQRVAFGFAEADRLANEWPGRLGVLAAEQAAAGGRLHTVIGGHSLTLNLDEARQLARLPSQLRWLSALADALRTSRQPQG